MSQLEQEPVQRKSDIPSLLNARLVVIVCSVLVASLIVSFLFTTHRSFRPGLLDGLAGLILALSLGGMMTRMVVQAIGLHFTKSWSESDEPGFSPLDGRIRALLVVCAAPVLIVGWVFGDVLRLPPPWSNGLFGPWGVFWAATAGLFARHYAQWYDSLPD